MMDANAKAGRHHRKMFVDHDGVVTKRKENCFELFDLLGDHQCDSLPV